jgi:FMN-dependent NADH-azoreductase
VGAQHLPQRGSHGRRLGARHPYFDDWLRWAGITDITSVTFRPNLATADVDAKRAKALADTVETAKTF